MKLADHALPFRSRSGFSLVELLVYMAILAVLLTLIVTSFTQTQRRSIQQSDIAETQIETGMGLGLLHSNLENAGFGLPWAFPVNFGGYNEPDLANPNINIIPPNAVPAALTSVVNDAGDFIGSDLLAIRATNVIRAANGQRWGYLGNNAAHQADVQSAGMGNEQLTAADLIIALRTGNSGDPTAFRSLVTDGAGKYAFPASAGELAGIAPPPTPNDPDGARLLLYGIADHAAPTSRPFNRTDYFIANGANVPPVNVPAHCAPGTGVLVKTDLTQRDFDTPQPVVDCVADFQVVYHLAGAAAPVDAHGLNGLDAEHIRNQLLGVRCYILIHEGGIDRSYTYSNNPVINVGEMDANGNLAAGRAFDVRKLAGIGGDWAHYRWKVVNVVVSPQNLR